MISSGENGSSNTSLILKSFRIGHHILCFYSTQLGALHACKLIIINIETGESESPSDLESSTFLIHSLKVVSLNKRVFVVHHN